MRAKNEHAGVRLLSELLDVPAPSGHEDRMAGLVARRLEAIGIAAEIDPAGNVLARLEGREPARPTQCLAAHIDELGLVVTQIAPDGKLRVDRLGGLLPWKLGERPVEILGDHGTIVGAVSMGSGHSPAASTSAPSWDGVEILTGLSPDRLREHGVRVGTPAVPVREVRGPFTFGDPASPWIGAWTFDNRLGVASVLMALEAMVGEARSPKSPTLIAFTVEEEVGGHGAKIVAHRERPDVFIAIDGSPLVPECPVDLDGRPAIRSRDRAACYDRQLLAEITRLSADVGVELQTVVYGGAASDASLVHAAGLCPRVACLGYVRASSHGFEVAPRVTIDRLAAVVSTLLMER